MTEVGFFKSGGKINGLIASVYHNPSPFIKAKKGTDIATLALIK